MQFTVSNDTGLISLKLPVNMQLFIFSTGDNALTLQSTYENT